MRDKVILVTGGTGSFGKAFVTATLEKDPRQIRVFSRDELKQSQMKEEVNDSRVEYLCGDIRDSERLSKALEGVDICIHAAAMKRIEKCETDPQEAIKTNITGSVNVANACLSNNVSSAILISTDKAVYPINLYGATKLVAEKVWVQSNTYRGLRHPTRFSVVRYGNVLGSRGSVVRLFQKQLEEGCIKVTDQRMTRFFITLQEAVDLVCMAIEQGQGGEIYVPKLRAASIYQLAHIVAGNVPIQITNQRGGEKLHEVLMTQEECKRTESFSHAKCNIIHPEVTTWPYKRGFTDKTDFQTSQTADQYTEDELRRLLDIPEISHS